jgi:hypothetical protein
MRINKNKHKCFPVSHLKEGKLTKIEPSLLYDSVPSVIDDFKGRQEEM